jgi:hypothetical protein
LFILVLITILAIPGAAHATPSGLVSWWQGESNANDSADSNNGTMIGNVTFASGQVGQAFSLDGSSYVDFGNAANLQVSSGDFTTVAWVNFDSLGTPCGPNPGCDMSIVDKMGFISAPNDDGWRLAKQADSHFWFCFGGGAGINGCTGGPPRTVRSTTAVTPGVWYHVAAVKNASTISLYVNGMLEASTALASFSDTNTANLRLGSYVAEGAFLDGLVDEVQLYNRALSDTEIHELFSEPPPDTTAPTITITTPADGANYLVGASIIADYTCQDEAGGSGIATCTGPVANGAAIDTATVGTKTFTVNAADTAGNPATLTHTYQVVYGFTGFFQPIDNTLPNSAKASQSIPVKWRLTDAAGNPISDPASFVSLTSSVTSGSCGMTADAIETYSGSSGLQYLGDGYWQFNWKTPKSYAGQCRTMTLNLNDSGPGHSATFIFT